MSTSTRRVLGVVGLVAFGLVAGVVAVVTAFVSKPERINRYWTSATVDAVGDAQVAEVIDYDFSFRPDRHGIYRIVPGLTAESAAVSVTSPDAPDQVQLIPEADGSLRIKVGDPATTITGRHRYELGYRLPGVERDDVVDWEAVGDEWTVGIEEAEAHLVTPFVLDEARCFASSGSCEVRAVEPGHVVVSVDDLGDHEGVSIEGRVGELLAAAPAAPTPPTDAPDDPGTGLLPPFGAAAASTILAALPVAYLVRRAGRERVAAGGAADAAYGDGDQPTVLVDRAELAEMATVEFAPPTGITPAQGGVVLRESVHNDHKVAWLIQAAIDGVVDIDEQARPTRITHARVATDEEQRAVLSRVFAGGPSVTLGKYDKNFADGWRLIGTYLGQWRTGSGLWDTRSDARVAVARGLGVLAAVAGLLGIAVGGFVAGRAGTVGLGVIVLAGLVAGIGVAAVAKAGELRVRTPAGSAMWLRVESFRRFLAASEAHHAEEAARRGVLREYTAWAVAVGEIGHWSAAVAQAAIAPDVPGVGYAYIAPALATAAASAAVAPSSSGGGGSFGGGGVGGGAGGGGGGSW